MIRLPAHFGAGARRVSKVLIMNTNAWWIWAEREECNTYNDTVVATRSFAANQPQKAEMQITADSYYRLFVNGTWIGDGPARAWPEHYSFDVLDLTPHLRNGTNEIRIIARHFGCGTFHRVPQQAGLLAQMQIHHRDGTRETLSTDETWQIANGEGWIGNTPKISIQMEPAELYDASRGEDLRFSAAVQLFRAGEGPWKNLHERQVALLTLRERAFRSFLKASVVLPPAPSLTMAHTRLMNPGLIEANGRVFSPFGIATELTLGEEGAISFEFNSEIERGFFKVAVDGRIVGRNRSVHLAKGTHFILGFARNIINNDKSISISLNCPNGFSLKNPIDPGHSNPWNYIPMREYAFVQDDMVWRWFADGLAAGREVAYEQATDELLESVCRSDQFRARLGGLAECLPRDEMFVVDSYRDFHGRKELREVSEHIENPEALLAEDGTFTVVPPCGACVELVYDLGEQNCGHYGFELEADAGVTVDIFAVEHINPGGRIQFTANNRNGFRYITRQGVNEYVSLKRRSGRYVFITFRNFQSEIRIRNMKLIESTYPVADTEIFSCSDERLNRITEISARTLKLCMEDVYTDCPLYEQTLWVGDLRNEALYGYYAFGATDIARNSLMLAAESSGRFGMIGAQVPSCWNMILPAWSFLWGIAAWEHFWFTGDGEFLAKLYPHITENIRSAEKRMTDRGLFSAPCWNMFDWAEIDQEHRTVLHNSMLFVGALEAAVRCARQLDDPEGEAYFSGLNNQLIQSINLLWDSEKKSYPDSVHEDGTISPSSSQHTSFLSLLYGIVEPRHAEDALNNVLNPPPGMVRVGSPFAIMYMYEALEKQGCEATLIQSILEAYTPMLEAGATTVWESYPQGSLACDTFPTRSYCHGWSAAPPYFFQRVILGVRQTRPGCAAFEISPHPCGLEQAQGTVKTPLGDIRVSWKRNGEKFSIAYRSPPAIEITFRDNESLDGYTIVHPARGNGRILQQA